MIVLLTAASPEDPEPVIALESDAAIGLYDDADSVTLDIPVDLRAGLSGPLPVQTVSVSAPRRAAINWAALSSEARASRTNGRPACAARVRAKPVVRRWNNGWPNCSSSTLIC